MDVSGELSVDQLINLWYPLPNTLVTTVPSAQGDHAPPPVLGSPLIMPAGISSFSGSRKILLKLDNRTQEGYARREQDLVRCFADQERCGFCPEDFTVEWYLPGCWNPNSTNNDGFDAHYNMFFGTASLDNAGKISWNCFTLDPDWQSPSFMSPENLDDLTLVLQDRTRFRLLRGRPQPYLDVEACIQTLFDLEAGRFLRLPLSTNFYTSQCWLGDGVNNGWG